MCLAHWCNNNGRGKVKHSGQGLWQCHFVHHKFHILWEGQIICLWPVVGQWSVPLWQTRNTQHWRSDNLTQQPKHKGEIPLPATSFTTKPTDRDLDIRPVFSVRSRTKITWAMARHFFVVKRRIWHFLFSVALQPKSVLGRGIVEVSGSHKIRYTHSVGLLRQSDQLVAEAVTYSTHIK
jgi:hypothetical protein